MQYKVKEIGNDATLYIIDYDCQLIKDGDVLLLSNGLRKVRTINHGNKTVILHPNNYPLPLHIIPSTKIWRAFRVTAMKPKKEE